MTQTEQEDFDLALGHIRNYADKIFVLQDEIIKLTTRIGVLEEAIRSNIESCIINEQGCEFCDAMQAALDS